MIMNLIFLQCDFDDEFCSSHVYCGISETFVVLDKVTPYRKSVSGGSYFCGIQLKNI